MANIIKFTEAERILLEIDDKHKFKLSFNEMLKLRDYLNVIGNITDFYFNIQSDFFKKVQDVKELEKFNNRISKEEIEIDFDFDKLVSFINEIVAKINDDELNHLLDKVNG
jgi:hypothetical protein